MSDKQEIVEISETEFYYYKLVIERLTTVIDELGKAISTCQELEEKYGFDMDSYELEDAMVKIAMSYASDVKGLQYFKPKIEGGKDED